MGNIRRLFASGVSVGSFSSTCVLLCRYPVLRRCCICLPCRSSRRLRLACCIPTDSDPHCIRPCNSLGTNLFKAQNKNCSAYILKTTGSMQHCKTQKRRNLPCFSNLFVIWCFPLLFCKLLWLGFFWVFYAIEISRKTSVLDSFLQTTDSPSLLQIYTCAALYMQELHLCGISVFSQSLPPQGEACHVTLGCSSVCLLVCLWTIPSPKHDFLPAVQFKQFSFSEKNQFWGCFFHQFFLPQSKLDRIKHVSTFWIGQTFFPNLFHEPPNVFLSLLHF